MKEVIKSPFLDFIESDTGKKIKEIFIYLFDKSDEWDVLVLLTRKGYWLFRMICWYLGLKIPPSKKYFIMSDRKVDKGDIIMPMIGTIGSPVIVDTDIEFAIKNVALIKFINNNVSNVFIKKVLDSNYFKNVINQTNRGNTQKFISLRDIRNIKIPIVPIKEQNQFADFVAQVDKSKLAVQQSLNELETLKKSLMQQYFG